MNQKRLLSQLFLLSYAYLFLPPPGQTTTTEDTLTTPKKRLSI